MKRSELEYTLPRELVAQRPAERRDESRLLVYDRASGETRHRRFHELPEELGDELVVVNDTRVVPARLRLRRETGGEAEVLLLERLNGHNEWEGLARPVAEAARRTAARAGRAPGAARRGSLAPAARGRAGRRGAPASVHHRAARRSRALPDGLRGARGLCRRANGRPPLHAGAARRPGRRAGDPPCRTGHVPPGVGGRSRRPRAALGALRGGAGRLGANPGRRSRACGGNDDRARPRVPGTRRSARGPHRPLRHARASSSGAPTRS